MPIHVSGSCSGSGGSGYGGGWIERETQSGQRFVFGWIEYPSYVNPNARCPVCGADVYFYQSPYGGRVFFDELGPPWFKHPCTSSDDSIGWAKLRETGVEHWLINPEQPDESNLPANDSSQEVEARIRQDRERREPPEWQKAGWSPLLLSKAEPTPSGVIIQGSELLPNSKTIERKFNQIDIQDLFHENRAELVFSYSMIMNPNRLISVVTENVVFIRRLSNLLFEFSTVLITKDGELVHFSFQMQAQDKSPHSC